MEGLTLHAIQMDRTGKHQAKQLRRKGFVPAILYGENTKPLCLSINSKDLLKMFHNHQEARHSVINLEISSDGEVIKKSVIIKQIQYDSINGNPIHIDFNAVSLDKAITLNVTVAAKGEPVGVKQDGGIFSSLLWELKVEGLASDIPKQIEVDVSNLHIGDCIHVRDITIQKGMRILNDPDSVVFRVEPPGVEKPAETAALETPQEPEVIKQKKPEESAEGEEKS